MQALVPGSCLRDQEQPWEAAWGCPSPAPPPPQAARSVLEDSSPLSIPWLGVLIGLSLPARVGHNDLVGQCLQAMVNDDHLQGLVG